MVSVGLFVRLEARADKAAEVESLLRGALAAIQQEPTTVAWFAFRFGPTTFGLFDAFSNEEGLQAHLSSQVAAALVTKAPELFTQPPRTEKVDILAAKLPGQL